MLAFDPLGSLFNLPGIGFDDPFFADSQGSGELSAYHCLSRAARGDLEWVSEAVVQWPTMKSRADRDALRILLPHVMSASDFALLHQTVTDRVRDEDFFSDYVDVLTRSGEARAIRLAREAISSLGVLGEEPLILAQLLVVASGDPRVLGTRAFKEWDPVRHEEPSDLHADWLQTFDCLLAPMLADARTGQGFLLGELVDLERVISVCLEEILPSRLGYRFVEIRPYLEAMTGEDLSGCFLDHRFDQNLARHELERLYDKLDFGSFETGRRYFFGRALET